MPNLFYFTLYIPLVFGRKVIHEQHISRVPKTGLLQTRDSAIDYSKHQKLHEIYGENIGKVLQDPELLTWVCSKRCASGDIKCHEACPQEQIGYLGVHDMAQCSLECEYLRPDTEASPPNEYRNCLVPCLLLRESKAPETSLFANEGSSQKYASSTTHMESSTARVTQVVTGPAPTTSKEILTGDGKYKSLMTTVQSTIAESTNQETPTRIQSNGVVQPPLITDKVETPSVSTVDKTEVEVPTSTTSVHLPVLASDGSTLEKETEAPSPTATSSDDVVPVNETLGGTITSSLEVGTSASVSMEEGNGDTIIYDSEGVIDRVLTTFNESAGEVEHEDPNPQGTVNLKIVPSVITVSPNADLESPISSGLKKVVPGLNFTNVSTSTKPSTGAPTTTLEPDIAEGAATLDTPLLLSFGSFPSVLLAVVIGFGFLMG